MVFQFQLIGLFIMFLLVVIYYNKNDYVINQNSLYKGMLINGYIMQMLYVLTFIAIKISCYYLIFVKLYFISVIVLSLLIGGYFVIEILREKYKNQGETLEEKIRIGKMIFIGFATLAVILIFSAKMRMLDSIVRLNVDYVSVFMEISLLVQLIMLFGFYQSLEIKKAFSLLIILIMEFVMLGSHFYFSHLAVLNSGMILIILYLYITLENPDVLENKMLKIERDNAIHNNIDKSSFLKNISHEIRIPINTIDGFSQVIVDSDDMEEIKSDIEDIRIASRDLIDIINGMIDLSIIEAGDLNIILEDYDIYDALDNVVEITKSKLKDKSVKFNVNIEKDIPDILNGDSERISQVLLNIITNSIKYTDKGKIDFKVEAIKSNALCRLKFVISDTGKGISKDDISHLFDYSDKSENKGIGLVVAKYLVELMNGKIDVSSDEGKGSTFVVTIDQKIISEKRTDSFKKKEGIKFFDASDKRILIVDDNKLNLKVASKLLSPYKVEVREAISGQECLDILDKDHDFDLILMDDMMPEKSGTETLNILTKIERVDGYYIPVVVLTANAISGMREKYLNSGFDDYLAKPIEREELDRILRKYLKKNS